MQADEKKLKREREAQKKLFAYARKEVRGWCGDRDVDALVRWCGVVIDEWILIEIWDVEALVR